MNEHDSEKIGGLLARRGLVPAPSADDADLFLLNTCSVREKAVQKVYSRLGELKERKRAKADFLIGVMGCVAQQEGENILKRAPHVDLVVGTHLYHAIPDLLDELTQGAGGGPPAGLVATAFLDDSEPPSAEAVSRSNSFRAAVTVMEGCNKHCAFCIVPHTRGKERNRRASSVLEEIRQATAEGFVEVLLLGQTVNSYKDPTNPRYRFAELLSDVSEIEGVERLRFTSPHPRHFTDDVISLIAERDNICPQVHLPLQSGSSRILRRMRRQHDAAWYRALVEKFRNCGRQIALSTDVIVGCPGETAEDFEKTLDLVRFAEFEQMFSFKYSPRPMTEAFGWEDDVGESEKSRRLTVLQGVQRDIQLDLHRRRYLDREFDVLVEGTARDGMRRFGRTASNKIVNFFGEEETGEFARVRITEIGPNSLVGEPVVHCRLSGTG